MTPMPPTRVVLTLAVVIAAVALLLFSPADRWLLALAETMRASGPVGWLLFAAAYITGTVLLLPGSLLTLVAGFTYGPVWGTLLVSPVSVAAATAAFLTGRYLARGWATKQAAAHPKFAAVDRAVAGNGFKVVLLLRLSPLFPFNLLNYALALTGVRAGAYVSASLLGMLPGTVLYVYLGSLITSAAALTAERPNAGPWGQALFVTGLLATAAVTWFTARLARRELEKLTDAP